MKGITNNNQALDFKETLQLILIGTEAIFYGMKLIRGVLPQQLYCIFQTGII